MSTDARNYYEQAGLWSGETADSADVIEAIMSMWPDDAITALDVGCGNGAITNFLRAHHPVVGGDFSLTALRFVTGPAVALSADALPFGDGCFDLTMATDVFEHLPDKILQTSIAEIVRVSRRYVFFCVPQHEPADYFRVECASCSTRFHAHHHQRPYDIADFASIPGTSIIASRSVGSRWAIPSNERALQMRDWTESSYDFALAVCPACHMVKGDAVTDPAVARLERRFEALQYLSCERGHELAPCRSELAVLLEKTDDERDTCEAVRCHDLARQTVEPSAPVHLDDVDFAPDRHRTVLATYPDHWTWLTDGETTVLVLPRSPERIEVTAGHVDTVQVYDAIDERYVAALAGPEGSFELQLARPDARGYRVQLGVIDPTTARIRVHYRSPDALDHDSPLAVLAFDSDMPIRSTADANAQLDEAVARATSESARADNNARRVDELYAQVQDLAAERAKLNELLNETEARRVILEHRLARRLR